MGKGFIASAVTALSPHFDPSDSYVAAAGWFLCNNSEFAAFDRSADSITHCSNATCGDSSDCGAARPRLDGVDVLPHNHPVPARTDLSR
jgi:hypothetical protein